MHVTEHEGESNGNQSSVSDTTAQQTHVPLLVTRDVELLLGDGHLPSYVISDDGRPTSVLSSLAVGFGELKDEAASHF